MAALLVWACGLTLEARAQNDTLALAPDSIDLHTPRGALWRAAAVPGWGQYYNRQLYKMPIVWAGIVGTSGFALYLNSRYLLYRHAYLYRVGEDQVASGRIPENENVRYKPAFDKIQARYGNVAASSLRSQRDLLRRNRDLSYFGIGLFYGLTVLDAYVNAHLLQFDVGEDLTVAVRPAPVGEAIGLVVSAQVGVKRQRRTLP